MSGAAPLQATGGSSVVATGRPAVAGFTTARGGKFQVTAAANDRVNRLFAGEEDLFAGAAGAGGAREATGSPRTRQRERRPSFQIAANGKGAGNAQRKGSCSTDEGNLRLAGARGSA